MSCSSCAVIACLRGYRFFLPGCIVSSRGYRFLVCFLWFRVVIAFSRGGTIFSRGSRAFSCGCTMFSCGCFASLRNYRSSYFVPAPSSCIRNSVFRRRLASFSSALRMLSIESTSSMKMTAGCGQNEKKNVSGKNKNLKTSDEDRKRDSITVFRNPPVMVKRLNAGQGSRPRTCFVYL